MSSPQSTRENSAHASVDLTDEAVTSLQGLELETQNQLSELENDYYPSNSEESEDSDDEEFERAVSYSVDLVSQEDAVNNAPVYTRSLLEALKTHVNHINQEFLIPPIQRTLKKIYAPGPKGKQPKIWDSCGKTCDNSIQVHYFAPVELYPGFQRLYGSQTRQICLMRRYNRSESSKYANEEEHFTFPYAIATYQRLFNNDHCS
ncbi:hypothetical protein PtrSN002B_009919 [Pyrenophora tritici-repentis]|uniref:Uncharacterized protein n=1 Tax=Pyrenophora tritici-repentis TaxID=45151 RepID=A0A2W1FG55_9PLEO|nr:hypothetical protein PtrV1_08334 [Pyrenophora tritici-repentis]KAF7449442.1 hypothetical protein A1F99_064910 [Pyrenophora tritici-repentis]KAF7570456.1 hypothetical protein PtrM4_104580 [Pyrenophora tritici-repentis]KAG9383687.1 hypothetical protein A1F94_005598 [Pyrenophora tritici-repentis]KAI0571680.1 hypothetical protein Alg215_10249 [Pyrenophora tritici-repentis]